MEVIQKEKKAGIKEWLILLVILAFILGAFYVAAKSGDISGEAYVNSAGSTAASTPPAKQPVVSPTQK